MTIALLNAAQLITLAGPTRPRVGSEMGELRIVPNGAMLIDNGKITAVGTSQRIESIMPGDARIIDAAGKVVLPGFVDAHAHPVFAGNRVNEFEERASGATYEQIAEAGGGIQSTVRATRAAGESELAAQATKHATWFLRCGTTTVEAKSGYGLTLADELKILRVTRELNTRTPVEFVPTFLGAHALPSEFKNARDRYVELIAEKMLPAIASERLAEFCDVFCEQNYFNLAASRKILAAAQRLGLGLRIHADQLTKSGGAQLAAELRALTADHLEQTDAEGIAALKKAEVQPVLLPGSVYSLGKTRYPRAREMIQAGLALVLATDFNPGSSPTPSMPMIFSLAMTQMKMSAAECVTASTINAAYSLRRGDKIGSLEAGKRANFSIFDCADYRELAYYFGFSQAHSVYIRGERVL